MRHPVSVGNQTEHHIVAGFEPHRRRGLARSQFDDLRIMMQVLPLIDDFHRRDFGQYAIKSAEPVVLGDKDDGRSMPR